MHSLFVLILSISSVLSVMNCFTHMITPRFIGIKMKHKSTKALMVTYIYNLSYTYIDPHISLSHLYSAIIVIMLQYCLITLKELINLRLRCP